MEVKTADLPATNLHGSEVGIARKSQRCQFLGGRLPTVVLNSKSASRHFFTPWTWVGTRQSGAVLDPLAIADDIGGHRHGTDDGLCGHAGLLGGFDHECDDLRCFVRLDENEGLHTLR